MLAIMFRASPNKIYMSVCVYVYIIFALTSKSGQGTVVSQQTLQLSTHGRRRRTGGGDITIVRVNIVKCNEIHCYYIIAGYNCR